MVKIKNGLINQINDLDFMAIRLESLNKYSESLVIHPTVNTVFLKKYTLYLVKCLENLDT
jgi:hypothetical protein